jgi:NNP family nitrate/nitrite transporter-like MFS transporter
VMYFTFLVSLGCLFVLSYPETRYVVTGIKGPIEFSFGVSLPVFVTLTVILGFVMSLGKAAVYKHIPVYYPHHVGSVGGLVGMIGGLGGFFLPIAFGALNDLTGVWTSCFMLLFALVAVSTIWMHVAIRRMEARKYPDITREKDLSAGPDQPYPAPAGASAGADISKGAAGKPAKPQEQTA